MADLVNCDFCGRDTCNKSRICKRCTEGVSKHTPKPDRGYYLDGFEDNSFDAAMDRAVKSRIAEACGE